MQKQLFTKTRWLVTIILLTTLSIGQMWGATAKVDDFLWREQFTGTTTSTSTTFSESTAATISALANSSKGTSMLDNSDISGLSYTASNVMVTASTGANCSGAHIWVNKNTTGYFQVTGIPVYNATKIKILWNQGGGSSCTASYKLDNGSWTSAKTTSSAGADISSDEISVSGKTTISIKFTRTSTKTNIRLDDLRIKVTEVAAAGTSVSLTKGASSNGSFTLSPASSVTTTSSAQTVTVTCSPDPGYYVSSVSATNPATGTATPGGSGNARTVEYSSGANGSSTITVTFSPIWYLKGDFNSWGTTDPLTDITSNVATVTKSLSKTTSYEFKVYNAQTDAWYGNNGKIIDDVSGWTFSTSENNCTVFATVADDYTFNFNISNQQMQVVYPDMTHPNDAYVYLTNWWDCYVHYWYTDGEGDHPLIDWGYDTQLSRHEEICGTDYWCVPILDGYPKLIMKDNAGNPSNTTGDQTTNSNDEKYITHNGVSWGWHDFATYTISYAGGGGTGSMSSHTDLCPGSSQALTANTFSKTHYTFDGWHADVNVKVGGSTITAGNKINNSVTLQDIQSNVNLTAQWAANSYTVTTNLTNVTPNSAFPASVTYTGTTTTALNRTLTVNTTNFSLPTSITVSMAGTGTLTQGTHYTYNNSTGAFAFNVAVTGNITITATAVAKLMSIAITTQPTKRTYFAGETFSSTGAVVTATWGDASTTNVTGSTTWTPTSALSAGTSQTVTATYSGKTATTTINVYSVTVNKVDEGGTAIADAGVTATWTVGSKALTAGVGSTKYVFKNWAFSGSNNGLTISNTNSASTTVTGTPTGNVIINAVFYNPVTITWSNNGVTSTTTTAYNTKPTFPPTPGACDETSTTFIGWATSSWDGKLNDVSDKTIHTTNSTMSAATSATTYYAVFAKASAGGGNAHYAKVTSTGDISNDGRYLIVYEASSTSAIIFKGSLETLDASPDTIMATISDGKIAAKQHVIDNEFTIDMTNLYIKSASNKYINYNSGTYGNGLSSLATTSSAALHSISIDGDGYFVVFGTCHDASSNYVKLKYNILPAGNPNNGSRFRFYKHTTSNTEDIHLYKYDPGVSYSEYMTKCCDKVVDLSVGAETHCDVALSTTSLKTCTGTDEDWQVTVTVTPDNGYGVPTNLTWTKTDGTVATPTKVSGPTGSGPYTYVYQFAQNQKGEGSFGATCTANNYTINLNDQSATTAATPSSISVTFDANTNLTGTVLTTPPTRTGFDFGGYYTATGGGGTQIIATDGTVNASAGGGSTYTDASKNWKYADNLTIYAKWTEKALENYRTACMTFEVTNQAGTDDPDIHLTSYKGVTVYATSAAGNLIRIQGKALEAAGVLGGGTNNKQNIRIKYFDMKSGSPVEVAKAQSPFHLCNDGTSNYNQADGSNININGLSSYDQTYSISYEPKEYGQTDHYQMEVRLQNNTTEAITVMVDLYGRSLPKEFVIATHSGASWYALPNDLAGTQGAQNLITPVAITVDNTSTPTKVTSVHDNVLYKGADRYTSANKNGLRFSNDGSHYLQVSTVLDVNKMWLSGSGGTDVQDWHLKSADFGAYEVYMDPIGTSTASDGRRIELYDSYIGYHGALTGTGNVYFLPMEYPEMGSSIMEWGTDHVVIFLATPGTATKVKVQVGGNAVGDAQTLSDIKKDEGVYRVTASLTTDDAGAEIKLYFYTNGDVLVGSDKFTIPKLISAHDATTSGISKALAAECDLVILNGGILTVSQSTSGTQLAFRDLYIYGGGKLVVPSGKYISFDKVIMRGGHLNAAWQYQYSHPQLVLNGTMTNAEGKIYYDYLTNNAQFYSLSLPYNVTLTDIVNPDFNNKRSWQIHGYDGAKRASGSQVEGWYDVEEGSTPGSIAALSSSDHLTAGVGYTFWGAMQKVNGVRQRWSVNRFKMTLASGSAEAEKSGVTVTAHGITAGELNDGVAPNDAGWNMLGNPYLADIGGTEGFETAVKGTIISWHNVKDEDENGNWTGTWHQESNETNVRYVRIPNNQGTEYEQTRFKDATLRAFHHFFIQVGDGGTFSFNISMRAQSAPSRFRKGASLPEEMDLDLRLTDGDNTSQFGLTLNNEFSASYNGGDEDMTEDLSGAYVKAYTLVGETRLTFNGLPYTAAEQLIPVGYRAQGNGYHTFSYKADADAHYIAHIWLTDKEESTVTDLKENTYKFYTDAGVNDERFTLNVVFTENTATGMDDGINDENGKPKKFIYRDQLYILRGGVIYDATGKRVREINK